MKPEEFDAHDAYTTFSINSWHGDYGVGVVYLADIRDSPGRPACFLSFYDTETADRQIGLFEEFNHQNIAKPMCRSSNTKTDIYVAVTKFNCTLKSLASKEGLFWDRSGITEDFRIFLLKMTDLPYRMRQDTYLSSEGILANVAFTSGELQGILFIRLDVYKCKKHNGKVKLPGLACLKELLRALRQQQIPESSCLPEFDHFMLMLDQNEFLTKDREHILTDHPILKCAKKKKALVRHIWIECRHNKCHLRNQTITINWKKEVQNEHEDFRERADKFPDTLYGMVKFARNTFEHIRDDCHYMRADVIHDDNVIALMLERVRPRYFVDLYCYKHPAAAKYS